MRGSSLINRCINAGIILLVLVACNEEKNTLKVSAYHTSAEGHVISPVELSDLAPSNTVLTVEVDQPQQEVLGIGGAFTQSTSHLLMQMSAEKRQEILEAYFSKNGAAYSFCRTHMNSCDFSTHTYSYSPKEGDTLLEHFSIERDLDDIIPIIKQAQTIAEREIKFLASPWTAPPWMKDNHDWYGGSLLPEYRQTWADFFVKYYLSYQEQGIPIWGFTVENEPLGNDANWESMHYTPDSMADFIKGFLRPTLKKAGIDTKVLIYDQNKGEEMKPWVDAMLNDPELLPDIDGTAVHWYNSTVDYYGESLQYAHDAAPDKHLIHSEACIDAEVPHWKDDAWYWKKEATDWGFDWAKPEHKKDHPKYVPAFRYARDIIGCLNNHVEGWIDWNMVLDKEGGPNHANNWCIAPVIVDTASNEVYYTPLYYLLTQFSRYIEPGARVLSTTLDKDGLLATAVKNPNNQIVCYVLNTGVEAVDLTVQIEDKNVQTRVVDKSLQTILVEEIIEKEI